MKNQQELTLKTIQDFGEQFNRYTKNVGYYASLECLQDILGPSMNLDDVKSKTVAEIGSGAGRIVNMLIEAGASQVTAVEPSHAFDVIRKNTEKYKDRIRYLNCTGDKIPANLDLDTIVSLGVIHHIPDPDPVLKACHAALKSNGKLVIWLYGHEGNELYLFIAHTLRFFTKHMPHFMLNYFARLMALMALIYGKVCELFPFIPMHKYFTGHYNKLDFENKVLTTYDQLNPAYAKYYTREEALDVVKRAGFKDVKIWSRHSYSWIVSGTK